MNVKNLFIHKNLSFNNFLQAVVFFLMIVFFIKIIFFVFKLLAFFLPFLILFFVLKNNASFQYSKNMFGYSVPVVLILASYLIFKTPLFFLLLLTVSTMLFLSQGQFSGSLNYSSLNALTRSLNFHFQRSNNPLLSALFIVGSLGCFIFLVKSFFFLIFPLGLAFLFFNSRLIENSFRSILRILN